MKSKIETTTPQQQEIDWGKVMLVRNERTGTIVLTDGDHEYNLFTGTIIVSSELALGAYITSLNKDSFQPLTLPQTITFYE